MKQLICLLAILLVTSCASKSVRKRTRAQKLINKAIKVSPGVLQADTVKVDIEHLTQHRSAVNSIPVERIIQLHKRDTITRIDTFTNVKIQLSKQIDTITKIEYLKVKADCLPIVELDTIEVPVEQIVYRTDLNEIRKAQRDKNYFKFLFFGVLGFLIFKIIVR